MNNVKVPAPLSTLLALALCGAALPAHGAPAAGLEQIHTVVVLVGENRSFDNLYGLFPGANGIAQALEQNAAAQRDRDGSLMATLPPVWKKESKKADNTASNKVRNAARETAPAVADPHFPKDMPNAPFRIDGAPINLPLSKNTRDLVHRHYQNQMQINGGKNDMFVAYSDAGALTMGYYDGAQLPMWHIARQYTLADNFFMGAFGGSYINHMWLACACTPRMEGAHGTPQFEHELHLRAKPDSPAKAADGPPRLFDSDYTPDGYTINTVQPTYQPSKSAPARGGDPAYADPKAPDVLPPQTMKTIGDVMSDKAVSWAWYAGGFKRALADHKQVYGGDIDFQTHHQPFNYFLRYAPGTPARAQHLRDGAELFADIAKGTLPQVAFYKPQGTLNEHPGTADVIAGDMHLADIVARLQASPQWAHMAIIVTYDENGGFWDHVAPPKGDRWGPGSRIPAIIISPYAKRGFIDHTVYDTTSILQFLTHRFGLETLPGIRTQFGDLSNAFDFGAH
ncbi:MAG: acid phosphatase [Pseudomonadota bacterium]